MIPAVRRQKLLNLLEEHEMLFLPDVIEAMDSSESTVRRDLKTLARSGEVELLRGGGIRLPKQNVEMTLNAKLQLSKEEKDRIARAAAALIYPGDVIFMDPSSANYLMIDYIQTKPVTVVTNSITHMNKLLSADINCIMVGGQIKKTTSSCIGPQAEQMLRNLRFSKCFLGANGISRQGGVTNHDPLEQSIKRMAIENSAVTYFLVDSAKFGITTMCKVAEVDAHMILTDKEMPGYEDLDNIIVVE